MGAHVPRGRVGESTIAAIAASADRIAAEARTRLGVELSWYSALSADDRSWIGLIAQSAIRAFVDWYDSEGEGAGVPASVFSVAPRELTRSITLGQTVELMRVVVEVVETKVIELATEQEEDELQVAVARFSREIAFAAAQVYAGAAEARGAWDARLESLVVDAVVRGEHDDELLSRATAIGWRDRAAVTVVVGTAPRAADAVVESMRGALRRADVDTLFAVQGRRLVVVLGGTSAPLELVRPLVPRFASGPVVVGPAVPHLIAAGRSARAALAGHRACVAWPTAPRPVLADDLLPERVLLGDSPARHTLTERVHRPLRRAGNGLLETAECYLRNGRVIEATARELFVHANTVRYRLARIAELIGYDLGVAREAWVVEVGLALGRIEGASALTRPRPSASRQSLGN